MTNDELAMLGHSSFEFRHSFVIGHSVIRHSIAMTHDEQLDHYILPNYGRYDLWPVRGEAHVCRIAMARSIWTAPAAYPCVPVRDIAIRQW